MAALLPLWLPQLQIHTAAGGEGVDSALLLSRSPGRGVRLFRVFRDDAYMAAMLDIVRELQLGHVAARRPPGPDPWVGRPGYGAFLERTLQLAAEAGAVLESRVTPQLPGTDANPFWTMR
ncbi:hypothetical protein GPECTOR_1062g341 [Gonium pectorale]|uniref:Uncharacterized protein n=1 Tax=Gonium pectorale TaxID=33097 RepID=A0A150FTN5_GONPE|nr:hypothetical protein GPECTOR_1062g341 [Gonium pectorale]|eukprot:KXZ40977.1 hypothetical protein GPECTOR_1062g341 [Gonium pectorale]